MNAWFLFAGILPLLAFVIVYGFRGLNKGILAAALIALAELALSLWLIGEVDPVTAGNLLLVFVMGGVAWKMKSGLVFKMQPVVIGLAFSSVLIGSYLLGQPFLTLLMTKYGSHLPAELAKPLEDPSTIDFFNLSTLYVGMAFLLQTMVVLWAALKLNNWWWLFFRSVGFYLALFLGGVATWIHMTQVTQFASTLDTLNSL